MKPEATETTGRDDNACTTQPYRLICIHNPDRTTGQRITGRSKKAVVQEEEQPAGLKSIRPSVPAGSGNPVLQEPAGNEDIGAARPAPENTGGGAP